MLETTKSAALYRLTKKKTIEINLNHSFHFQFPPYRVFYHLTVESRKADGAPPQKIVK
jgi:hypothetical protein